MNNNRNNSITPHVNVCESKFVYLQVQSLVIMCKPNILLLSRNLQLCERSKFNLFR